MKTHTMLAVFGVTIGMVVVVSLYAAKDRLSVVVWENLRMESIALALNKDATLARRIGGYYFNVGGSGVHDLERAKWAYGRALEMDEGIKRVHFQLARIAFIEGHFSIALEEIHKELEVNPTYGRSYYVRALIYGYRDHSGDLARAESDFKRFIEWEPTNWAGYNDLAWIQIRLGKYAEGKETVLRAFMELPFTETTNPWLWTVLGVAELNIGNYTRSRDAFITARSISSNMTPEYFWSAYPGNSSKNAITALNQFNATLSFNLGIVYERLEDYRASIEEYTTYLNMLPEGPYPSQQDVEEKIKQLSILIN